MANKFEDCRSCRFGGRGRSAPTPCDICEVGEFFEDRDRAGVDAVFRDAPTRFGESITTDEQPSEEPRDE